MDKAVLAPTIHFHDAIITIASEASLSYVLLYGVATNLPGICPKSFADSLSVIIHR